MILRVGEIFVFVIWLLFWRAAGATVLGVDTANEGFVSGVAAVMVYFYVRDRV